MTDALVTAGIVVIGDEVLSGRTKDTNSGFIAEYLNNLGIDVKEIRVVGDEEPLIVEAINTLRARYTYVFTTGGIGPTHDDITADAVGAAFGREVIHDERAVKILMDRYSRMKGIDINDARMRMARMPTGSELIDNPVSGAPGFRVENVHVMAGVPKVMQAMMDAIAPTLKTNARMISRTVDSHVKEGDIAHFLGELQKEMKGDVLLGSYPYMTDNGRFGTKVVARSRELSHVEAAERRIREWLSVHLV